MITSIAIDDENVFSLDTGAITRWKLDTSKSVGLINSPPSIATQLMTTDEFLYVLCNDGRVFRKYTEHGSWDEYDVPANTTLISSNDTHVFVVANDIVYRQHSRDGAFHPIPVDPRVSNIVKIDNDEEFAYVLLGNGQIFLKKFHSGAWDLYSRPLSDVIDICAGTDFLYALTATGSVYRTKVVGRSGWDLMGAADNVSVIAIPSTHDDELWLVDGGINLMNVRSDHWSATIPPIDGWVVADWVGADWVLVA